MAFYFFLLTEPKTTTSWDRTQYGCAHNVVIFEFDGFVLFSVGGGVFADIANGIKTLAYLIGPITGNYHARVVDVTFREIGRASRVSLIGEGNPVVHDGATRVDGKAETITILACKLNRTNAKIAAGPDDGNRCFVEVGLQVGDGFFEFSLDEFIGRVVVYVDVVNVVM